MLEAGRILGHAFVVGELALSHLRQRTLLLDALLNLPQAIVADEAEVRYFIDHHRLFGQGIGYVDAHLLAAVKLTEGARFWTKDKRLYERADVLGLAVSP